MSLAQAPAHERSVQFQKGVGPSRAALLAELGVLTLEDACYLAPRRYEDRRQFAKIADLTEGQEVTIKAKLRARSLRRVRGGRSVVEAMVQDASGALKLVWFNAPYLERQLVVGQELVLFGHVERRGRLQMIHPEWEALSDGDEALHAGRIVPVYPLTRGISQRWLRRLLAQIVEAEAPHLEESLPEDLLRRHAWPGVGAAVRELHFPQSWEALEAARRRLAFEELLVLQMALVQRKNENEKILKPQRYAREGELLRRYLETLPFALTGAQRRVLDELLDDLALPHPMQRLVQGDVGCGKTAVVMALMAVAVQSGHQVALMAPTELLAEQHARTIERFLGPLGITSVLLAQAVPAAERRARLEALAAGRTAIAVGTHALLQEPVRFADLSLVVVDEQHKFGVSQRAALAGKAEAADILILSATPIPRTLALSLYGDLAIATIDELPPGRKPVRTYWIREEQRPRLYERIRGELDAGRQGYVVYPLVEERAGLELKAAVQMAEALQAEFPEAAVGLVHGQMKPKEKEAVMRGFAEGRIRLLISTVVIEVGIDVPNAGFMVIEHPERFGLAQLHQLRGRIGRGGQAALCVLIGEPQGELSRQRLEAFVGTTDGFVLAEKDLDIRGPGELVGFRQHGWAPFRIADIARDREWLEEARREAQRLLGGGLRAPGLSLLRERLKRFRKTAAAA